MVGSTRKHPSQLTKASDIIEIKTNGAGGGFGRKAMEGTENETKNNLSILQS